MRELTKIIEGLLKEDVKPAMGCTEPACCALAVAHCSSILDDEIISIDVKTSPNILKNGLEVGIPGTQGLRGLGIAVALGALIANPEDGLELFKKVNSEYVNRAREMEKKVRIGVTDVKEEVYVEAVVTGERNRAKAIIGGAHDSLIYLEINGDIKVKKDLETMEDGGAKLREKLVKYSFREMVNAIEHLGDETVEFMMKGLKMNLEIANFGLEKPVGMGVGYYYKQLIDDFVISSDLLNEAKMYVSAAVDSRMYGIELPVMSSSGSGNQGILATVPLYIIAKRWGQPREKLVKAMALSHITNSYIKYFTGKLSAMCGCVTAGIGTALGAGYLLGLKRGDLSGIINNMVGNLAGIICDGAKVGCALKLATGVDSSLTSALLVQRGIMVPPTNGICGNTAEETIVNMARVVAPGMFQTDDEILKIMLERNRKGRKIDG